MPGSHRNLDSGRLRGLCLALALVGSLACVPGALGSAGCSGRRLLTCWEKSKAFADGVNWGNGFVLDVEPFEARLPLHLGNPALAGFWRFETSSAAARAAYEFELQYEIADPNFEQVTTPPALPPPSARRSGIVSRRLAATLTSLMRAEQREIVDLAAMNKALNRATEASYERGRSDWVAWQEAAAAHFASGAAAAIGNVIARQRAATRGFVRTRLFFGVGSEDLKLAHRAMRRHGLARSIRAMMQFFDLTPTMIDFLVKKFDRTSFGQSSFSLSQILSQSQVIAGERGFQAALRHFADRIPPASRPPQ